MANLIRVILNDSEVWMEPGSITSGEVPKRVSVRSAGEEAVEAGRSLQATIRAYCASLVEGFQAMSAEHRPQKIKAEFGLKLSGDSKFYIVSVAGEGSVTITAEWKMK